MICVHSRLTDENHEPTENSGKEEPRQPRQGPRQNHEAANQTRGAGSGPGLRAHGRGADWGNLSTHNPKVHSRCQRAPGKTDTPEVEFYEAIELAEAQAIHHAVKMIHDATPKDWRAAAWILERLEPERWNLSKRFEHSGPDGTAIETTEPGPVIVNLIVRRPEGHEDEVPPFTFADHSEVDHLQK